MQKIKMSVYWMFMILVGCRLSHSTQSGGSGTCNEKMEKLCVPVRDNVTVPCPEMKGEEVHFKLLKNEKIMYRCTHGENALNCTIQTPGVEALHDRDNISMSFVLTGVNATSDGFYRCETSVTFPPPYDAKCGVGILMFVKGQQCDTNCSSGGNAADQNFGIHWIWIIALVSTYGIAATVTAVVFWHKLRKIDSQSDYINTKPKAPRERRRKRGVHNPVPRYF